MNRAPPEPAAARLAPRGLPGELLEPLVDVIVRLGQPRGPSEGEPSEWWVKPSPLMNIFGQSVGMVYELPKIKIPYVNITFQTSKP